MLLVTHILVLGVACRALIVLWFQASLFKNLRDFIDLRVRAWGEESVARPETSVQADIVEQGQSHPAGTLVQTKLSWEVEIFRKVAPKWVYHMLQCPMCFSVWAALSLCVFCEAIPAFFTWAGLPILAWPPHLLLITINIAYLSWVFTKVDNLD